MHETFAHDLIQIHTLYKENILFLSMKDVISKIIFNNKRNFRIFIQLFIRLKLESYELIFIFSNFSAQRLFDFIYIYTYILHTNCKSCKENRNGSYIPFIQNVIYIYEIKINYISGTNKNTLQCFIVMYYRWKPTYKYDLRSKR